MIQLLKVLTGSRVYGTSHENSDYDYRGIYLQPTEEILKINGYIDNIKINKDYSTWEIKRFLELAIQGNPTAMEILFTSEKHIIEKDNIIDILLDNKHLFLTKNAFNSFAKYGLSQIKKAKGLDKKFNYEKGRTIKKTPIDFCYVIMDGKTIPLSKWLDTKGLIQENCGLVNANHARDVYFMYYSEDGIYKGIEGEKSNEVRLSHIPKGQTPIVTISYNKDGYTQHCKDYNSYQTWLKERNTDRYIDTVKAGQQIDSKNVAHCVRLLDVAEQIVKNKDIQLETDISEYLIEIRKGKHDLDRLIENSKSKLEYLEGLYNDSDLPHSCDIDKVNDILLSIRR